MRTSRETGKEEEGTGTTVCVWGRATRGIARANWRRVYRLTRPVTHMRGLHSSSEAGPFLSPFPPFLRCRTVG